MAPITLILLGFSRHRTHRGEEACAEICCEGLAEMVTEADKSLDLLSAGRGPRRASVVPSTSEGLRNRRRCSCHQKASRLETQEEPEKTRVLAVPSGKSPLLLCLSLLSRSSTDWTRPTRVGEGHLLYSGFQLTC